MILLAVIAACVLEKSDTWGPDGKLPLRAETVVSGLEVPWSFAFLPGGDVLVSERPGRVRLLHGGKLAPDPVLTVKTAESSEGGLLGIAVNPRVYDAKTRTWRDGDPLFLSCAAWRDLGGNLRSATADNRAHGAWCAGARRR